MKMDEGVIGILKFALAREIDGRDFYKSKIKDVKNEEVKNTIAKLAGMEEDHIKYIRQLIQKVNDGGKAEIELPKDRNIFIEREKKEIAGGKIDDIASDLSIIRMGFLIEDDFMNFYKTSSEKVKDEELKKVLLNLSSWEETHREMLDALYREMSQNYWNEMHFTPLF
jgi:rubrerythrin|uniref:Rubrerythrin n=1 Tax=Mesoaciditoga lauensis TaxID=1495039 RepID=A0A7V3VS56_9BACT